MYERSDPEVVVKQDEHGKPFLQCSSATALRFSCSVASVKRSRLLSRPARFVDQRQDLLEPARQYRRSITTDFDGIGRTLRDVRQLCARNQRCRATFGRRRSSGVNV